MLYKSVPNYVLILKLPSNEKSNYLFRYFK